MPTERPHPAPSRAAQQTARDAASARDPALPAVQAAGPLALCESDLARLPVFSLRAICLSKPSLAEALPWALAGGLCRAEQRFERDSTQSLSPASWIRVCDESFQLLAERFGLRGPDRFDLLWAACLGASRLSLAHGQARSPHDALFDFFSARADIAKQQIHNPNQGDHPVEPFDLGAEFDDPRVQWPHIPPNALHCALHASTGYFAQLSQKPGFKALLTEAIALDEPAREACALAASRGPLAPEDPVFKALEISKELGAWNRALANLCAFPGRNWPYAVHAAPPFSGRDNIQALAPQWPQDAFDPNDPLECALRAQRHDPDGPWASEFLRMAGSASLRQATIAQKSFHGLFRRNEAPLMSAAKAFDRPRLETLMDLIDHEGAAGWSAWADGAPPAINLRSSTQPKAVDWLFGLGSLGVDPALVARALESIPSYSPSQSRPIARWLRERSERASTRADKEEAQKILDAYFPLFEALDLAQASQKASQRAASRRGEGPAAAPSAPSRRL